MLQPHFEGRSPLQPPSTPCPRRWQTATPTTLRALLTSVCHTNGAEAEGRDADDDHRVDIPFQFHVLISEAPQMKTQRRMRSPWYQLVLVRIKARLCCSVSGSWLQSQCLWLHHSLLLKYLHLFYWMVILYWWPWCILRGIQQRNVRSWKHFSYAWILNLHSSVRTNLCADAVISDVMQDMDVYTHSLTKYLTQQKYKDQLTYF